MAIPEWAAAVVAKEKFRRQTALRALRGVNGRPCRNWLEWMQHADHDVYCDLQKLVARQSMQQVLAEIPFPLETRIQPIKP